jgi:hypothetical protein
MNDGATSFQSPVDRRSLQVIGAVVLTAILLLTAYSLLTGAGSDASSPTSRPATQRGATSAPSIAALSEPPDIRGTISVSTPRALTIETQTGPRVVRISEDTRIVLEDASEGTREDLLRDTPVAIVSETKDGGRTFTATEIAILPR